ncbi:hypothetical protein PPACK8108_LOCUS16454 [Phakopsora pachyrhizi]|uniref:Uncharacterized protein n=1 Tax=Phakopsora pachyrhizi TaxID=170000 RepID=A0AAV0B7L7_PHAPC|nr:hypothetical protein PPACK8108_LOCUS16454 [Phakopsora pachyrhizi]
MLLATLKNGDEFTPLGWLIIRVIIQTIAVHTSTSLLIPTEGLATRANKSTFCYLMVYVYWFFTFIRKQSIKVDYILVSLLVSLVNGYKVLNSNFYSQILKEVCGV